MKESKSFLLLVYKYIRSAVFSASILYGVLKLFGEQIPILYPIISEIGRVSTSFAKKEVLTTMPYFYISATILYCFLFIVVSRIDSYWFLKLAMSLVGMIFMLYCAATSNDWNVAAIAAILFYVIDSVMDALRHKKESAEIRGQIILSIAPFLVVATLLTILLPMGEKPINWKALWYHIQELGESALSSIYRLKLFDREQTGDFAISLAGVSPDVEFTFWGKQLIEYDQTLMNVENSQRGDGYLIGTIRDRYTANGWEKIQKPWAKINEYQMNYYEILYNLYRSRLPASTSESFCKRAVYEIHYKNMKVKSVFYPQNGYYFSIPSSSYLLDIQNKGEYLFRSKKNIPEYSVSALYLNMEQPQLVEYLKSLEGFSYQKQEVVSDDESEGLMAEECLYSQTQAGWIKQTIFKKDFSEYLVYRNQKLNEIDLDLPENLPVRVYDLAQEITKGQTDPYSKILAIEDYLKKNYRYQTGLEELPKGHDFVDYFLFDRKQGNCVCFSSSMAILSRCIGIPSRYVEGVVVNYKEKSDDVFSVKNSRAHAWTEIYMQGFGWIKIDATPGTRGYIKVNWEKKEVTVSGNQAPGVNAASSEQGAKTTVGTQETKKNNWWKYVVGFTTIMIVFLFLCYLGILWKQKNKYAHSSQYDKLLSSMEKSLSYLEFYQLKKSKSESLQEYMLRNVTELEQIQGMWKGQEEDIRSYLEWYQVIRYSEYKIAKDDVLYTEYWEKQIKKTAIDKRGKLSFLVYSLRQIRS